MTQRRDPVRREETARGSRIVVPLGGADWSLTIERAAELRDELRAALGASALATEAHERLLIARAPSPDQLSDPELLARLAALRDQPLRLDPPAPTVRASVGIAPDVDSGQWYYRVALTLRRAGRRDLRLLSDIRGWAESEASEHARQLAEDIAAGGVAPARDDDVRVATLEIALRDLIARVRSTGGYAAPEEQDVLLRAERALAGVGR